MWSGVEPNPWGGCHLRAFGGTIGRHSFPELRGGEMGKSETTRRTLRDRRREKRAAKTARTGDTPEKLAERAKPSGGQSPKDVAEKAGLGGFVGGF
jgi:hypothetical protein